MRPSCNILGQKVQEYFHLGKSSAAKYL